MAVPDASILNRFAVDIAIGALAVAVVARRIVGRVTELNLLRVAATVPSFVRSAKPVRTTRDADAVGGCVVS